jgi:O-acetyl-ADP-ribose deacetylase (regulator of RNase III)
MTIIIQKADLTTINCDAIVNPANSYGYMGGGVAGAIKRCGGSIIEKEAIKQSPILLGTAVSTTAGTLPCHYVIHAPTMKKPAMNIPVENVENATYAALQLSQKMNIKTIALPGMGTGIGGVPPNKAATAMINVVKKFEGLFEKIYLIDRNDSMITAFKSVLEK